MNDEYGYLNEEELEVLIAEVKQRAMIAPPVYLKEQIMDEVRKEEKKCRVIISPGTEVIRRKEQMHFLIYSTKIVAAAAAAILCLTVVPVDTGRTLTGAADRALEKRISADVEKYKEEQKRIEEEMVNEIYSGQTDKAVKKQRKEDDSAAKGGLIREKLGIGQSDHVSQIINNISNLFGTEERKYD